MKKTIMKRMLAFGLTFAMLIANTGVSLAAAKKSAANTQKADQVTLKFVFPLDAPKAQDEVTKALEKKLAEDGLNYKLQFTFVPFDQYWNKLSLIAASGEDQDITWTHVVYIPNQVAKKTLAPLNSAIASYGKDIVANTPKSAFKEVTVDGNIYGIPRVMPMAEYGSFVQIRGDLRKKYKIPEIKDVAGMDKYLAAVAKNEKGMIPYFNDPGRFLIREYGGDVAYYGGDYFDSPIYIDPADKSLKVRNTYDSTFFKKIFAKMREWQSKGYIPLDKNQVPDAEAALNSGKLAATQSFVLKQTERIDTFKASMPNAELENVYLHPEKPKYKLSSDDNVLAVFSSSKHVNEAIKFINWMRSSQENYDLFTYGIKGVNYKLIGNSISYDGIAPEHDYQPVSWSWNDIKYYRFSKNISPQYAIALRNWDKTAVISPTLGFVPNFEPVKTEIAQINAVIGEYKPMLYNSKIDWDSTMTVFKKKLKDAGIDNVINEVQKQFNAFKAKNK